MFSVFFFFPTFISGIDDIYAEYDNIIWWEDNKETQIQYISPEMPNHDYLNSTHIDINLFNQTVSFFFSVDYEST